MEDINSIFRIAVCDDERVDLEEISARTSAVLEKKAVSFEIEKFQSGAELLERMKNGCVFDLLLLDVMMDKMDGMELAEYLRGGIFKGNIIFISYNREMAMRGYEVSAVRYLSKPLDDERLREAVLYAWQKNKRNQALLLPGLDGVRKLLPKDVLYVETAGRRCQVIAKQKKNRETISVNLKISEMEALLSGQNFIRCHQGFLVNLRFVQILRKAELELLDGEVIPVSKHRLQEVRRAFFTYMESA